MPLPIKQYKHMFKDVKFLATTAQPSYKEVSHWIDLLEDPTGGTIKVWNGTSWKKISGEGDGDTEDTELDQIKSQIDYLQEKINKFVFVNNQAELTDTLVENATKNKQAVICTFGNMSYPISSVTVGGGDVVTQYMRSGDWQTFQLVTDRNGTKQQLQLTGYGEGTRFLSDDGTYKKVPVPSISNLATKDELNLKQDTLVSGTNIKTINGNSLLGEGNIEIQGGGEGIADAPSDGKKYVRQNANWVEETTVDTSNFATTAQLANKVDTSTYTEDKATFATKAELGDKANTSDLSNYLTTTDAESNYAKKSEIPSLEGYLQTSTADEKYATKTELSGKADTSSLASKQDTLVSGTNIKTINNQSLLGNGNIDIAAGDSKVYVFELSKYIGYTNPSQRFTGTIGDDDFNSLQDALTNGKLILGEITDSGSILGYIPLQVFSVDGEIYLKGEHALGPICLGINGDTKTYQGYFYSETIMSNDSSTVTVTPLPDEPIQIYSGTSTLTNIDVDNLYDFRLLVETGDQNVTLDIRNLKGLAGATFDSPNIILEANSKYEIDVENDIAIVAKITSINVPR